MAFNFAKDDKEKSIAFWSFMMEHARFDVTMKDAITLSQHLNWYNSLPAKIEDHVFEVEKITQTQPKEEVKDQKADLKKVK